MDEEQLTQGDLKRLLDYDENTGIFVWNIRIGRKIKAGSVAGSVWKCSRSSPLRYIRIKIRGKKYQAHRLAVVWMTGKWPEPKMHTDHRDRNGLNNAWNNLRQVTASQNGMNSDYREAHVRRKFSLLLDSVRLLDSIRPLALHNSLLSFPAC